MIVGDAQNQSTAFFAQQQTCIPTIIPVIRRYPAAFFSGLGRNESRMGRVPSQFPFFLLMLIRSLINSDAKLGTQVTPELANHVDFLRNAWS